MPKLKYALLAALAGVLIAVMVAINGELTAAVGNYPATVIIHIVGLIAVTAVLLISRQKLHSGPRLPLYMYMGGVVGVGSVLLNNYTYAILGVSVTLALGLLGQLVCSIIIDQFGLFGMPKQPLKPHRVVSAAVVLAGTFMMMMGGN